MELDPKRYDEWLKDGHEPPATAWPRQRVPTMELIAGERWHVVHSANISERSVQGCLRNSHYDFYYPKTTELRKKPKRLLTTRERQKPFAVMYRVEIPIFHRYYLVKFEPEDRKCWELFRAIGIQGIICNEDGLRPAPVLDGFVEALRKLEVNGVIPGKVTLRMIAYEVGEHIRIKEGPFAHFSGIVQQLPDGPVEELDEASRLKVLVALFGRSNVVEMALGDIEKL